MAEAQPESSIDIQPGTRGQSSAVATLTGPVARFMYALPFLMFGIMHFMNTEQMSGVVPAWLPAANFWVYLTGAALIAAAIAIASNRLIQLAGMLLAVLLLSFVFTVHLPGVLAGGEGVASSLSSLLKDTALAGGALMAAHYASHRGESAEE
jgi:uncharacterized membrane protein YphA (DoxX/SURF4 family)